MGRRSLLHRSRVLQLGTRWSGRTASACRAASATSVRIRRIRRPIPNNPKWENLSSNVGAQYFWVDRIFYWDADPTNFVFQLFHTSRPGSLDTSLISTDNINNPRTMNAVYLLLPRLLQARRWGKETLAGGGLEQPAVQRLREGRSADAVLRGAEHGLDAPRAEGRLRFGRRARRAQPRVTSTSGRSAKSGCCTSTRSSAASASRRLRLPTRGRIRRTSRPPRRRRSTWPGSFSRRPAPTI